MRLCGFSGYYAVVVGLLLTTTAAEKKVNLEDIERDNLRSEGRTGSSKGTLQQKSYQVKPETDSEDYRSSSHQYEATRGFGSYSSRDKPGHHYHADSYMQANQPSFEYQHQPEDNDNAQYTDYQEQDPKQYYFTPEINVGNRYQTIQQKVATEKNSNGYKSTVYIPMSQLLAYYAYLSGQRSQSKPLEALGGEGSHQMSVPVYTSDPYGRSPVYMSSKLSYKPQPQYITYASQYPSHTQAVLGKKGQPSKLYSHVSSSSSGTQTQNQNSQYLIHQELIYPEQYSTMGTHQVQDDAKSYTQTDSQPPSSHLEQYYRYITPEQLQYLVSAKTIYQQPEYHQSLETPEDGLMPPQSPAQNFKSSYPSSASESTRLHYLQNHLSHSSSSEPKSLLDSYVPSHIIAAQDVERYRERPIKLESGFLPSKINFIHSYKKRKTQ
ncbi:hypothetical protein KQX54_001758 [Cotesia glomerata]|uniref:Uncharacterized protein n=2 Tax=Cotesia glomerata TaxID=32391 RepID=A0AAV7IMK3_COTGL|nr:hypothetical protein KQX54_001758 [Cotesia glomerata]